MIAWIRAFGFVAAAAIFWVQYFDLKDYLHPEPRRLLIYSYFLGAVAAGIALAAYWVVPALGGPEDAGTKPSQIVPYCFFIGAPIEEGAKFFVCRVFIFRTRHFDEPIDGLIYSSAVSIGFAGIESLLYAQFLPWPELAARTIASPLTHSLFSAAWGFGTGIAFFHVSSPRTRFLLQAFTLILGMLAHGLYDSLLIAYHATFLASGFALFLWAILIAYARRLVQSREIVVHGDTETRR